MQSTVTQQRSSVFCEKCGAKLILIEHVEYDGELGNYEPYWECPNGCNIEEDE